MSSDHDKQSIACHASSAKFTHYQRVVQIRHRVSYARRSKQGLYVNTRPDFRTNSVAYRVAVNWRFSERERCGRDRGVLTKYKLLQEKIWILQVVI